jgi:hypothetical protein
VEHAPLPSRLCSLLLAAIIHSIDCFSLCIELLAVM